MYDKYKFDDLDKEPEIHDVNFVVVNNNGDKEGDSESISSTENTDDTTIASENETPEGYTNFNYRENKIDSENKKKKNNRKSKIAIIVAVFLASNAFAGSVGAVLALNSKFADINSFGKPQSYSENIPYKQNTADDETSYGENERKASGSILSTREIVKMNENSVVEISTEGISTDSWLRQYVTRGGGSGVIISSEGYIVTNYHVIEGANKIKVTLKNEKSYDAIVIGHDEDTDLAVIKINAEKLDSVIYGNSKTAQVGETAVVIGNPLGNLGGTVTLGIISALDRQLDIEGKSMRLLQTDASVNPGNSGGGMFNDRGELIGVVVAKSGGTNVEGLGFAIPVDKVKTIVNQLTSYGYVKGKVSTGMTYVDLTSMRDALVYGVTNLGIYIQSVDSELAKNAGFKSGDMVYYVEKNRIESFEDLKNSLEGKKVGDELDVRIVRNDKILKLKLTLGEKNNSKTKEN